MAIFVVALHRGYMVAAAVPPYPILQEIMPLKLKGIVCQRQTQKDPPILDKTQQDSKKLTKLNKTQQNLTRRDKINQTQQDSTRFIKTQ